MLVQKLHFIQAQYKLPEDGTGGPKHVAASIGYFNLILTFYMFNKECMCWYEGILTQSHFFRFRFCASALFYLNANFFQKMKKR